jgi:hypothetical protein
MPTGFSPLGEEGHVIIYGETSKIAMIFAEIS